MALTGFLLRGIMRDSEEKKTGIDLKTLDSIKDIDLLRRALRELLTSAAEDDFRFLRADHERIKDELETSRKKEMASAAHALKAEERAAGLEGAVLQLEQERDALKARLGGWESKSEELEASRRSFMGLMSQLNEARKTAAEAKESLLDVNRHRDSLEYKLHARQQELDSCRARLRELEDKAARLEETRRSVLSIMERFPGGADAKEAMLRMLEDKNSAENRERVAQMERDAALSRVRDWEARAADLEKLREETQELTVKVRRDEKSVSAREEACARREEESGRAEAARRRELDDFKAKMKAEVESLRKAHGHNPLKDTAS